MKYVTMTVLLVLSSFASAHGLGSFAGTWALATSPGDSYVALTNGTAWVKNSGVWHPGGASQSGDSEISFRLVDDPSQTYCLMRNLLEKIFSCLSDDAYEKQVVVEVARERFKDFHLDWGRRKVRTWR